MKKKHLRELVYSRAWLPSTTTVEGVIQYLREHKMNFVPIVHEKKIFSMVCLNRLQQALATPYGWSLLSKKPILTVDFPKPLIFSVDDGEWLDLMKRVVNRPTEIVYDDVVFVEEKKYIGLVSVRHLMMQQIKDHEKQMDKILQQKELLKKTISTYMVDHSDQGNFDEKIQMVLKTAQKLESLDMHRKIDDQEEVKLKGHLELFSVTDLVQLIFQSRKTGRLEILMPEIKYEFSIYFEEGQVKHAECADHLGKSALWAALQCQKGEFTFYYDQTYPLPTIEEDTMYLLMEGFRLMDEKNFWNEQQSKTILL